MGKPFDSGSVPKIEIGKTAQADLRAMFGEPDRHGIDDGDKTWTYLHYRLALFGKRRIKDLYIRFNENGTVKSYSFNTNYH